MLAADVQFDRLLDSIHRCMLDNRHGIEREKALVKATPTGLTRRS
jgi:hypothetical protein